MPTEERVKIEPIVVRLDPAKMSGEEMMSLFQKVASQDYAFDDFSRAQPQYAFTIGLVADNSYHFIVNDGAYVTVRNVFAKSNADIHFVVWDKDLPFNTIIEAGKQILDWLFIDQSVNRVAGFIPKYNPLALRFAKVMGFRYEGTLRQAILYKGNFEDVDILGLLRKDFSRRGVN